MAGIILSIEVDDKGTVKIKQFSDETKKAFDQMKKGPEQAKGALSGLQESWVGITAKITAATAVVYGVSRALSSFVNEAAEAEQIENRLRFALETTGYTWQYAKSAVDQFANSIQESTRFSDEQARQALTNMMIYTNDFAKAQEGARLAMDMSTRTGQDLYTTVRMIGMMMSGNVDLLGRYIPELRNLEDRLGSNATMAQKAEYGLKILNEKFSGTAQADMNSYAGSVAKFKNAWSELKETIGTAFLPVLKETFEWLTKIINAFQGFSAESASQKILDATIEKFRSRIEELKEISSQPGLVAFQKEMIASQIAALEEEIRKLEAVNQKRQETAVKLAAERKADILPTGAKAAKEEDPLSAYNAIIQKANEWGEVVNARQELTELGWVKEKDIVEQVKEELANLEREANEWGEITVGRQELVEAGWERAKKQAEEMKKVWTTLSGNISSAWNFNVTGILRGTTTIKDAFKNMVDGMVDSFINAISKMITQWLLFGSVTGKTESSGGFLYGGSWSGILGGILGSLQGGIESVPQTGPYLLHKGEAVVPEGKNKGMVVNNYYIQNTTNQITANDTKSFADLLERNPNAVVEILRKDARAAGAMKDIIRGVNS